MRSFPLCAEANLEPELILSFVVATPSERPCDEPCHIVYRNDVKVGTAADYWWLFRLLEWQLDIFLADAVQDFLLLHAGAVTRNGAGFILPGPSGRGKSSLTTALLLHGYHYLSDELAVIDRETAKLSAFPKAVSLKNRSIFPGLVEQTKIWFGPQEEISRTNGQDKPVWYVHPQDITSKVITDGSFPICYIIFPKYEQDSSPQLQSVSPAQAMHLLLENSVNFSRLGKFGLHLLAKLVQEAQCFSIITDSLATSVKLIDDLVDETLP